MKSIDLFIVEYVEFYDLWNELITSRVPFDRFSSAREKAARAFINVVDAYECDYSRFVECELERIFFDRATDCEFILSEHISRGMTEKGRMDVIPYFLVLFVVMSLRPPINISRTLRRLGFEIIQSEQWNWDMIQWIINALVRYHDPVAIDLIGKTIETASEAWYHDDIGQEIWLYLDGVRTKEAYDIISRNLNHPVSKLGDHLRDILHRYREAGLVDDKNRWVDAIE